MSDIKMKKIQHWHMIMGFLIVYDAITVVGSFFLALWFRFDCQFGQIPMLYLNKYYRTIAIYTLYTIIVYYFMGLYRSIWRFASFYELKNIVIANIITSITQIIVISCFVGRMPISYYVFGMFFQLLFCVSVRFIYRFILLLRENKMKSKGVKNVLLIGAGAAGRMILRDINFAQDSNLKVVAIVDDNPNKWNRQIDGINVIGGRDIILSAVKEYSIKEIYIAITKVSNKEKRDLINICRETDCVIKQLPNIYSDKVGDIKASSLQNITIEDVLGRDTISLNQEDVAQQVKDKIVLVTGGGGSIGSELCRQIASYKPKQLIIFDIYENNAYDIQLELKKKYPELKLETIIGSVRDSKRIEQVFERYKPNICYHAAAHKHVPLMEDSPCEAIKNNVIGTYKTAYAAVKYGCDRFVLISTDKAVNPTNIMGASKRMCEMVIQTFDKLVKEDRTKELVHLSANQVDTNESLSDIGNYHTEFVAVRFGNVLGSNGSVVPLFKKQIAEGGPVTVTHPDIIRYFMTIPEAVSLVLKSGCEAKGGEIFVLDMGEPVKIADLARNMIKLSGLEPDIDIKIEYVGLRPGEKLYEEKLMAEEGLMKTEKELIYVAKPLEIDEKKYLHEIRNIMTIAYDNKEKETIEAMMDMVPTFKR